MTKKQSTMVRFIDQNTKYRLKTSNLSTYEFIGEYWQEANSKHQFDKNLNGMFQNINYLVRYK